MDCHARRTRDLRVFEQDPDLLTRVDRAELLRRGTLAVGTDAGALTGRLVRVGHAVRASTATWRPAADSSRMGGGLVISASSSGSETVSVGCEAGSVAVDVLGDAPDWSPAAPQPTGTSRRATRQSAVLMPLETGAARRKFLDLKQERVTLAAAGADRRQAEPAAVAAQLVDQRPQDAGAGGAHRMAERDRAPVHVHLLGIGPKHLHRVDGDDRKPR